MDPDDRVHPTTSGSANAAGTEAYPNLNGARILVVDDELDCVGMVQRILEKQGAEVTPASSGKEALAALVQQTYHTVISDIGMPEMDGYKFIQEVRLLDSALGGHVPAVALTAFARTEDRRKAMTAGFDNFISKPVDPAELLAVISRTVSRGKQM